MTATPDDRLVFRRIGQSCRQGRAGSHWSRKPELSLPPGPSESTIAGSFAVRVDGAKTTARAAPPCGCRLARPRTPGRPSSRNRATFNGFGAGVVVERNHRRPSYSRKTRVCPDGDKRSIPGTPFPLLEGGCALVNSPAASRRLHRGSTVSWVAAARQFCNHSACLPLPPAQGEHGGPRRSRHAAHSLQPYRSRRNDTSCRARRRVRTCTHSSNGAFLYSPDRQGNPRSVSVGRPAAGAPFKDLPSMVKVALHVCGNGVPQLLDGEPVVSGLF